MEEAGTTGKHLFSVFLFSTTSSSLTDWPDFVIWCPLSSTTKTNEEERSHQVIRVAGWAWSSSSSASCNYSLERTCLPSVSAGLMDDVAAGRGNVFGLLWWKLSHKSFTRSPLICTYNKGSISIESHLSVMQTHINSPSPSLSPARGQQLLFLTSTKLHQQADMMKWWRKYSQPAL